VAIPRVRFQATEDAAAELQRLAAGDLHVTDRPAAAARCTAHTLRQPAADRVVRRRVLAGFNLTQPPFENDRALREVQSLAMDRDMLTRHVTGLHEQPAPGVVPGGIPGDEGARVAWSTLDQERREALARELYCAAGYSEARPLVLALRYNTSTPHRRMALASMWREVLGAKVRLRNEEWKVSCRTDGSARSPRCCAAAGSATWSTRATSGRVRQRRPAQLDRLRQSSIHAAAGARQPATRRATRGCARPNGADQHRHRPGGGRTGVGHPPHGPLLRAGRAQP
jgi:ABC-type transport system substrate-binding protein